LWIYPINCISLNLEKRHFSILKIKEWSINHIFIHWFNVFNRGNKCMVYSNH
jgi:hypothetical protein